MGVQDELRNFKVSEITQLIKQSLESDFYDVRIEGEISNFRPSSTGHLYFTLKDADAMISAVMFRNRLGALQFQPEDGQLVVVRGNISVYAKRGTYQIICESIEMAGEGALLAMLEERKRRLAAEGLFDAEKKQALPLFPAKVAVITSPTGAAIRDILRVTSRRNAGIDLVILPAPVQGEGAAEKIATQIRISNTHHMADVIIVGRGGGSPEDLLPFSEEAVVRAIASSEIPVISAVGHEIDISLSDLAADIRAPTPSAAAELVSANRLELLSRIQDIRASLGGTLQQRLERVRLLLSQFKPELLEKNFRILLQPLLLKLDDLKEMLIRSMNDKVNRTRHAIDLLLSRLQAGSPLKVLERGFALVTEGESGRIVTKSNQRKPGDFIQVKVFQGSLSAKVEEVTDEEVRRPTGETRGPEQPDK